MPIRALLMDIDDTLFDFQTSSRNALSIAFRAFGLPFTPEMWERYRAQSIMIGDSLSSDMQGGRNAGIPTCLYGRTEPISPLCDYAVADLLELPALLSPL